MNTRTPVLAFRRLLCPCPWTFQTNNMQQPGEAGFALDPPDGQRHPPSLLSVLCSRGGHCFYCGPTVRQLSNNAERQNSASWAEGSTVTYIGHGLEKLCLFLENAKAATRLRSNVWVLMRDLGPLATEPAGTREMCYAWAELVTRTRCSPRFRDVWQKRKEWDAVLLLDASAAWGAEKTDMSIEVHDPTTPRPQNAEILRVGGACCTVVLLPLQKALEALVAQKTVEGSGSRMDGWSPQCLLTGNTSKSALRHLRHFYVPVCSPVKPDSKQPRAVAHCIDGMKHLLGSFRATDPLTLAVSCVILFTVLAGLLWGIETGVRNTRRPCPVGFWDYA